MAEGSSLITFTIQYNQVEQLRKNHQKAEELLLEMSKRKGFEAAFAEPLFLTWPLARFGKTKLTFYTHLMINLDFFIVCSLQ